MIYITSPSLFLTSIYSPPLVQVSVETSENGSQMCSLWLKGLPREAGQEQRWVAVLEPIEITQAKVSPRVTDCKLGFVLIL